MRGGLGKGKEEGGGGTRLMWRPPATSYPKARSGAGCIETWSAGEGSGRCLVYLVCMFFACCSAGEELTDMRRVLL